MDIIKKREDDSPIRITKSLFTHLILNNMKKKFIRLGDPHHGKGSAQPGAQRKPMTEEEKLRQRERLKSTPDSEKNEASKMTACWITDQLGVYGFDSENGPFSETEMDGDAVWVLCTACYLAIWNGEWRWPEERKLSTQMIQIAKSKMAHIVRDFTKRDKAKDNLLTSQMTYTQIQQMEEAAGQWEMEVSLRDFGYEIAVAVVGNDALLLRYLEVLYEVNAYDLIADRMNLTPREVYSIERKLLKLLAKH